MIARGIAAFAAFCVGWVVYMVAMMVTTYDGVFSLIMQPFVAVLVSLTFVAAAFLAGLLMKALGLAKSWSRRPGWAALLAGLSLGIMLFGTAIGVTAVGIDPETGRSLKMLHPAAAVGSYFTLIFAVTNWPIQRQLRALRVALTVA